jgi:hypothetical protein
MIPGKCYDSSQRSNLGPRFVGVFAFAPQHTQPGGCLLCSRPPPPCATSYLQQGTGYPLYESPSRRLLQGAIAVRTDRFYSHCTSTRAFDCLLCSRPTFPVFPPLLDYSRNKIQTGGAKTRQPVDTAVGGRLGKVPKKAGTTLPQRANTLSRRRRGVGVCCFGCLFWNTTVLQIVVIRRLVPFVFARSSLFSHAESVETSYHRLVLHFVSHRSRMRLEPA